MSEPVTPPLGSGGHVWKPSDENTPRKQKISHRAAAMLIVAFAMASNLSVAILLILHVGPSTSSLIDAQRIAIEKACPIISSTQSVMFVTDTANFYKGPAIVTIKGKKVILDATVKNGTLTLSNHDTGAKVCSVKSTLKKEN